MDEGLAASELNEHTEQLDNDDVVTLKAKIRELQEDNERLALRISRLQESSEPKADKGIHDTYTFSEFFVALGATRGGQTYGWKKDYAEATRDTVHPVTTEELQKWKRTGRVPDWAYQQIPSLTYPTRVGKHAASPEWTESNDDYLIMEVRADPKQPNAKLATKCSEHFGREIHPDAIKGKKYRLWREGKLPEYRPRA